MRKIVFLLSVLFSFCLNGQTLVSARQGGTGIGTYTIGDLLYSSGTQTLSRLGIGSNGQVLSISGGVPTWTTAAAGGLQYASSPLSVSSSTVSLLYGTGLSVSSNSLIVSGLTNSHLSGSAGITNANLANSTISGISLGSNLNSHSTAYGLSGTSYNGSAAVSDWRVDTTAIASKLYVTAKTALFITGNQSITFTPSSTGDVTGSATGATTLSPTLTIGAGKVTSAMLANGVVGTNSVVLSTNGILTTPTVGVAGFSELDFGAGNNYNYQLLGRSDVAFGVPYFRAKTTNKQTILDLFPNGTASPSAGDGITHFDACDADNMTNLNVARLGIDATNAWVGTVKYGSATAKPFHVRVDGGNAIVISSNGLNVHNDITSNAYSSMYVSNAVAGAAASARMYVISNVAHLGLYSFSSTFTNSGMRLANQVALLTDAAGQGLNIGTEGAYPLKFWTNNTQYFNINSTGKAFFGGSTSATKQLEVSGDISLVTAGNGIYVKEGTNATMGTATLSGGTVVVSTTKVTANSRIFLTINGGTLTNIGSTYVSARTAGTSFTITSTNILDASNVAWIIIEPN